MKKVLSVLISAAVCAASAVAVPASGAGTEMLTGQISVGAVATSGQCGDSAYWELDGSTLKITGTGAMSGYPMSTNTPWYSRRSSITSVVISDGITEIGSANFAGLSITSVSIPSSVTTIGRGAFSDCRYLQSVDVPESVTYIAANAFKNCSSMKEIYIRNPKCTVSGSGSTICTLETEKTIYFNGTIYAPSGSRAETYANAYKYNFKEIDSSEGMNTTQPTTTTTTTTTTKTTTTTTTTASTSSTTITTTIPPDGGYKLGDVNNDGFTDAVDASLTLAEYAKRSSGSDGDFDEKQSKAADVDLNGLVDAVDASKILAYYAYLSSAENSNMTISEFINRK